MYEKYTIEKNDNLKSIASKFNTFEETILDLNNLDSENNLRVGMDIIVPKENVEYFKYYTIKQGDTIYQIARQYNINPELLSVLNGIEENDYIYPNQVILIPQSGYSYYITKEGDTLDIVSDMFNINKEKLLNQNKIIYLMPGQLLINKNM